jgi:hypothetical protein
MGDQVGKDRVPFATTDGRPTGQGQTASGGVDLLRQPSGSMVPGPARNPMQSRPQAPPPARPMAPPTDPIARANRQQSAPQPATQRVSPTSVAADGVVHGVVANAPVYRAGTGSVGNDRRPFKFSGQGASAPQPAPAPRTAAPPPPAGLEPGTGPRSVFKPNPDRKPGGGH